MLIHEKFAQRNGLSVGDTMLLKDVEGKNSTIPVTWWPGSLPTPKNRTLSALHRPMISTTILYLQTFPQPPACSMEQKTDSSVQYGDFYVDDPDELERIMDEVKEIPGVAWEDCTLTRYDNDYQNAKESLEGLQNIVFIAIAVVSVICFLVLALFLTLRLRGRIHETGIYLAMGISKGSRFCCSICWRWFLWRQSPL